MRSFISHDTYLQTQAAAVIVPLPSPVYKKPTPAQPLKAPPPPPPPPTRASPQPPPPVKPPRNRQGKFSPLCYVNYIRCNFLTWCVCLIYWQECIPLCLVRCKLHSRKKYCLRACMTCCERCKCVPPGQYGNKEKCGKCYSDMTTRGGKLKCPWTRMIFLSAYSYE